MEPSRPGPRPEEIARGRGFRQSLPRPARATRLELPGAAFAGLEPPDVRQVASPSLIETALGRLSESLSREGEASVAAAVLLALGWEEEGGLRLLVIRRAAHLRRNPGEIAFPGGAIEPGESIVEAALREAEEEVGLPRHVVRVLGHLPPAARRSRRPEIAPVVGLVEGSPRLEASDAEVEEIFLVDLAEFFDPSLYWEEEWAPGEEEVWRMHFFDRGEDVIWGASARILVTFLEALAIEAKYARSPEGDAGASSG